MERPTVAVVPFGARSSDPRAGAIARGLAQRIVERVAPEAALELRPVFLVAMPEHDGDAGYLVMGSTPDPSLAAQYAGSLDCTHALTGIYRDDGGRRELDLDLVKVEGARVVAERTVAIGPGALPSTEHEVVAWLAHALGVEVANAAATTAIEDAYREHLAGIDEELNATLLRQGDAARAAAAGRRALEHHVAALRHDPAFFDAERRLLALAAASIERGEERQHIDALERVVESSPRSWRAHYLLAELRRSVGDVAGAIVAYEHSHSLHPLRDADLVRLAELYVASGALGQAAAHLRAVKEGSDAYGDAQLVAGVVALHRGDEAAARAAFDRGLAAGARSPELRAAAGAIRLERARTAIAEDRPDDALRELARALEDASGEVAARAHRLRLGLAHPDLERDLERAGAIAVGGDLPRAAEARAAFRRVLEADDRVWEAHFGLGLIERHAGDAEAAARAFRRVLELWPDQPDALHELGVALLMRESSDEAVRVLDRAAELRAGDAGYLADAGFAHLKKGELAAARERLERARALDASDEITQAYLRELARIEAEAAT